jgi:uncharacterized protein (DUF2252 family)
MTTILAPPRELLASPAERAAAGKALRDRVPRSSHSGWVTPPDRIDPWRTLADRNRGRPAGLVGLENARLAQSPFAFFWATADIMAADLARTPASGGSAQLCGDAHCLNFSTAAIPEGRAIFALVDFDETLPGPWEWDLKRLASSLVLAARAIKVKTESAHAVVAAAVASYRLKTFELATKGPLEMWSAAVDATAMVKIGESDPEARRRRRQIADTLQSRSMAAALARLTVVTSAGRRFRTGAPPERFPIEPSGEAEIDRVLATYVEHLAPAVRILFERYGLVDAVPSPAWRGGRLEQGWLALVQAGSNDARILELRPAAPSVLEPYVETSSVGNPAERIVNGQQLMQNAVDPLLGWGSAGERTFTVRQLRTAKTDVDPGALDGLGLRDFAHMCGSALALAHARSGDAALTAGYLGKGETFDKAIVRFALLYAAQAEQDHASFRAAIDAGSVPIA